MKLVSVHRILEFKQSDWLKKYIDFNKDKWKNAANSFEKGFFSVFDKTMENLRKRINVRLVDNAKGYIRYIRKPSLFHRRYLVRILLLFMRLNQF